MFPKISASSRGGTHEATSRSGELETALKELANVGRADRRPQSRQRVAESLDVACKYIGNQANRFHARDYQTMLIASAKNSDLTSADTLSTQVLGRLRNEPQHFTERQVVNILFAFAKSGNNRTILDTDTFHSLFTRNVDGNDLNESGIVQLMFGLQNYRNSVGTLPIIAAVTKRIVEQGYHFNPRGIAMICSGLQMHSSCDETRALLSIVASQMHPSRSGAHAYGSQELSGICMGLKHHESSPESRAVISAVREQIGRQSLDAKCLAYICCGLQLHTSSIETRALLSTVTERLQAKQLNAQDVAMICVGLQNHAASPETLAVISVISEKMRGTSLNQLEIGMICSGIKRHASSPETRRLLQAAQKQIGDRPLEAKTIAVIASGLEDHETSQETEAIFQELVKRIPHVKLDQQQIAMIGSGLKRHRNSAVSSDMLELLAEKIDDSASEQNLAMLMSGLQRHTDSDATEAVIAAVVQRLCGVTLTPQGVARISFGLQSHSNTTQTMKLFRVLAQRLDGLQLRAQEIAMLFKGLGNHRDCEETRELIAAATTQIGNTHLDAQALAMIGASLRLHSDSASTHALLHAMKQRIDCVTMNNLQVTMLCSGLRYHKNSELTRALLATARHKLDRAALSGSEIADICIGLYRHADSDESQALLALFPERIRRSDMSSDQLANICLGLQSHGDSKQADAVLHAVARKIEPQNMRAKHLAMMCAGLKRHTNSAATKSIIELTLRRINEEHFDGWQLASCLFGLQAHTASEHTSALMAAVAEHLPDVSLKPEEIAMAAQGLRNHRRSPETEKLMTALAAQISDKRLDAREIAGICGALHVQEDSVASRALVGAALAQADDKQFTMQELSMICYGLRRRQASEETEPFFARLGAQLTGKSVDSQSVAMICSGLAYHEASRETADALRALVDAIDHSGLQGSPMSLQALAMSARGLRRHPQNPDAQRIVEAFGAHIGRSTEVSLDFYAAALLHLYRFDALETSRRVAEATIIRLAASSERLTARQASALLTGAQVLPPGGLIDQLFQITAKSVAQLPRLSSGQYAIMSQAIDAHRASPEYTALLRGLHRKLETSSGVADWKSLTQVVSSIKRVPENTQLRNIAEREFTVLRNTPMNRNDALSILRNTRFRGNDSTMAALRNHAFDAGLRAFTEGELPDIEWLSSMFAELNGGRLDAHNQRGVDSLCELLNQFGDEHISLSQAVKLWAGLPKDLNKPNVDAFAGRLRNRLMAAPLSELGSSDIRILLNGLAEHSSVEVFEKVHEYLSAQKSIPNSSLVSAFRSLKYNGSERHEEIQSRLVKRLTEASNIDARQLSMILNCLPQNASGRFIDAVFDVGTQRLRSTQSTDSILIANALQAAARFKERLSARDLLEAVISRREVHTSPWSRRTLKAAFTAMQPFSAIPEANRFAQDINNAISPSKFFALPASSDLQPPGGISALQRIADTEMQADGDRNADQAEIDAEQNDMTEYFDALEFFEPPEALHPQDPEIESALRRIEHTAAQVEIDTEEFDWDEEFETLLHPNEGYEPIVAFQPHVNATPVARTEAAVQSPAPVDESGWQTVSRRKQHARPMQMQA